MVSKEKIAHELTIIYLNNKYGIDVSGEINISTYNSEISGNGTIRTEHLPSTQEHKYKKIKTGEKGFLGVEKKIKIEDGDMVDDFVDSIVNDYFVVYEKIITKLGDLKE